MIGILLLACLFLSNHASSVAGRSCSRTTLFCRKVNNRPTSAVLSRIRKHMRLYGAFLTHAFLDMFRLSSSALEFLGFLSSVPPINENQGHYITGLGGYNLGK